MKAFARPRRPVRRPGIRESLRAGAWLGWQIEVNWAHPAVYTIYALTKPVSASLLIIVLYVVVTAQSGIAQPTRLTVLFLGSSFDLAVPVVLLGLGNVILEDRERYRMLPLVAIAPSRRLAFFVGRGASRLALTTVSVTFLLLLGVFALGVPLDASRVDWLLLAIVLPIGLAGILALGLLLAGITLTIASHNRLLGESVAGVLYVFSGALFPLAVLPGWAAGIGRALPITYWLEGVRIAIGGEDLAHLGLSRAEVVAVLSATTAVLVALAWGSFNACWSVATRRGFLDRVTHI